MTRYLGIDYGSKRIGLSIGDDQINIASPLHTLVVEGHVKNQVACVRKVEDEYDIDAFVVGLAKNMDNTEGKQAKLCRAFGDALIKATGKKVHYFDERLSTHAADELLRPAELTRKKKKNILDSVAAQVILQCFLDARTNQSAP